MCGAVWCLLLLLFCPGTDEMVLEDKALASQSRCHTYELERGQNGINSFKRHSDGTFTNDYTHSLDKIKAKEFVHWLASTKRERKWIQFNGYQSTKRYTDKEAYTDFSLPTPGDKETCSIHHALQNHFGMDMEKINTLTSLDKVYPLFSVSMPK